MEFHPRQHLLDADMPSQVTYGLTGYLTRRDPMCKDVASAADARRETPRSHMPDKIGSQKEKAVQTYTHQMSPSNSPHTHHTWQSWNHDLAKAEHCCCCNSRQCCCSNTGTETG